MVTSPIGIPHAIMANDRLWQHDGGRDDKPEEMVSLLSRPTVDWGEEISGGGKDGTESVHMRSSSLESDATAVISVVGNGTKPSHPLKVMRLAVGDVAAVRRLLEKLESDLLHATDSLHFNSVDLPAYKRDMLFVDTLTPIATKANDHAGCASRISVKILEVLHDYATSMQSPGSSGYSVPKVEPIVPLVGSLSEYMMLIEKAVNEAAVFCERPDIALDALKYQINRMIVVCCAVLLALLVIFVIVAVEMTVTGPPVAILLVLFSIPLSFAGFLVVIGRMKIKERDLRKELNEWMIRDTALAGLRRAQLILMHFSDCQIRKTVLPETTKTRLFEELVCAPEEWKIVEKELQATIDLFGNSSESSESSEVTPSTRM